MFRSLAKPFFGVFFVLVLSVIISAAACNYDAEEALQELEYAEETPQDLEYAEETEEEVEFLKSDLVTDEKVAEVDRMFGFIGDLKAGARRSGETLYIKVLKIVNTGNAIHTARYRYIVPSGHVHYMAVVNVGINAAVCSPRRPFIFRRARFTVRVHPRRTAILNIVVGVHW